MAFDPIGSIIEVVGKVLDKVLPDPKAKADALQKLAELQQNGDLAIIAGQNKINEIEAANPTLFVSGARPFIIWVCGVALAFQLVVAPLVMWGYQIAGHPVALPVMQTELLTTLLVGLLGLGGMRTVEKLQGVASK
jgi:hypothetical protein